MSWNPLAGLSELTKRVIFGVIFGAIALFCTLYNPLTFYALVLGVALLMYAEWLDLTRDDKLFSRFGGLAYVGIPVWSIIALRGVNGPEHILVLFALVWGFDTAAYFGGKRFGKNQLAPQTSPGKTWEGFGIGIGVSMLIGAAASYMASFPDNPLEGLWVGFVIAVIAQIGDLAESWIKRRAGVKDAGTLIPGHGGIMDRVDGLVFAAPIYMILLFSFAD